MTSKYRLDEMSTSDMEQRGRSVPREAIAKLLTEAMDAAVANGADRRSMPDEYVEIAAWLCEIPALPAPSIPEGWRLYLADFSGHAAGRFDLGNVVLIRDPAGRTAWNALSEADKDKVPLYMTGKGRTVQEAIEHACRKAAGLEAKP